MYVMHQLVVTCGWEFTGLRISDIEKERVGEWDCVRRGQKYKKSWKRRMRDNIKESTEGCKG